MSESREVSFQSTSETETRRIGAAIGERLKPGTSLGLSGTLGTGKTRLVQGIGVGLQIPDDTIVSPTFTLCVPYSGRLDLYHLDAYRIRTLDEVDEFGLDEVVEEGGVLVVEWAELVLDALPPLDLLITIDLVGEGGRQITIRGLTTKGLDLLFDTGMIPQLKDSGIRTTQPS